MRRNAVSHRGYLPHTAHRLTVHRRALPRKAKVLFNEDHRAYVQAKLKKKWPPEQISHRLKKDFLQDPAMRVSTETIYQAIYVQARGELNVNRVDSSGTGEQPAKRTSPSISADPVSLIR